MVTFNIVEGGESEEFIEKFIEAYNDTSMNVPTLCEKLDISHPKYLRIKKELATDGKIDEKLRALRQKGHGKLYYYNKHDGRWRIIRKHKGKQYQFMSVKTEEMAKFCTSKFHEYGWSKRNVERIRREMYEVFSSNGHNTAGMTGR